MRDNLFEDLLTKPEGKGFEGAKKGDLVVFPPAASQELILLKNPHLSEGPIIRNTLLADEKTVYEVLEVIPATATSGQRLRVQPLKKTIVSGKSGDELVRPPALTVFPLAGYAEVVPRKDDSADYLPKAA